MSYDSDESSLKTLTRAELRESVYSRLPQLSRSQISNLVDAVFEEMALAFLRDEPVKLRGFGTFKIRKNDSVLAEIQRLELMRLLLREK